MRAPAWRAAEERFTDGFGSPPELDDPEDRAAFMALLEEEVAARMGAETAEYFRNATESLEIDL